MKTIGNLNGRQAWIYPYGFMQALIFLAINLLLLVLTLFVVPSIVLEKKTIREAVVGSFAMMRKTWAEASCLRCFPWSCRIRCVPYLTVRPGSTRDSHTTRVCLSRPTYTWFALASSMISHCLALLLWWQQSEELQRWISSPMQRPGRSPDLRNQNLVHNFFSGPRFRCNPGEMMLPKYKEETFIL